MGSNPQFEFSLQNRCVWDLMVNWIWVDTVFWVSTGCTLDVMVHKIRVNVAISKSSWLLHCLLVECLTHWPRGGSASHSEQDWARSLAFSEEHLTCTQSFSPRHASPRRERLFLCMNETSPILRKGPWPWNWWSGVYGSVNVFTASLWVVWIF